MNLVTPPQVTVMRDKARKLIEEKLQKDHPGMRLTEVQVSQDGCQTRMTPDGAAEARAIVEKHFTAMGEELESNGCKFTARVNEGYASVDFDGCAGGLTPKAV